MRDRVRSIKVCPLLRSLESQLTVVLDPDFLSFLESLAAPVVKPDVTTLGTYRFYSAYSALTFLLDRRQPCQSHTININQPHSSNS